MSSVAVTHFFCTSLRERCRIMGSIKPGREEDSQHEGTLCTFLQETQEVALREKNPVFSFPAVDMQEAKH